MITITLTQEQAEQFYMMLGIDWGDESDDALGQEIGQQIASQLEGITT